MRTTLLLAAGAIALAGCGDTTPSPLNDTVVAEGPDARNEASAEAGAGSGMAAAGSGGEARATLRDADGAERGTATAGPGADGLTVTVTVNGLPPGEHGFHVHTIGRCDPPTFESAGGHWNPTARQHGRQNPQGQHLGDLPNLTVAADGTGSVTGTVAGGTVNAGANALLDADGAAIMVHENPDDYRTDPTGDAGGRIACGVFEGGGS